MAETSEKMQEMPRAYNPAEVEQKWYQFWMEKGYFKPVIDPSKKPFTIIMPPPNVTGDLHMGHALTDTVEDIMIRWHRMKGDSSLWLPGVDHASIAAQVVVERQLAKEGLSRHQVGREKFLMRMQEWAKSCRGSITIQHQRLGASCDWSRERFTMDEGPSLAVRTAFVRLYNKELIYRGERIINWCPRCTTALSDLEVDHQDISGQLYFIRYHLAESSDYITVATTRPETLLGDTGVAVNPNDDRFKNLIGKKAIIPYVNRIVPIIADEVVDPSFGTGAVKVTPSHDPVDFEIAGRHNLPAVNILNPDGSLNENAGPYKGLDRFIARKQITLDLKRDGLLVKTEPYTHAIGHCQRCSTVVEPISSRQWFVKMEPLAKPALEAVLSGRIKVLPERFIKVYTEWLTNIRDWCISRQLWWGHRIPVWYCPCGETIAAAQTPLSCPKCGSKNIYQDNDVLDTWFSSALWPHSTLGWPKDTEDYRYFYPTSVMETGYDILFFWVARMIIMGLEDTGDIPFHTVYLHGLVRDAQGEKMSKMKGNVIDPMVIVKEYGADALRFALSTGSGAGNDMKMSPTRFEAGRNFANKLWNAGRFVISNVKPGTDMAIERDKLPVEDRWILSRYNQVVDSVTKLMESFEFGDAEKQIYDFLWGEFCDWYIEMSKIRLRPGTSVPSPVPVLVHVLEGSLRLLHPYMPFITEELWQHLTEYMPGEHAESIMIAPYPVADLSMVDTPAEQTTSDIIELVHAVRNARAEYKVDVTRWIAAELYAGDITDAVKAYANVIETLARVRPVTFFNRRRGEKEEAKNALVLVLKDADVVIPMESMVDMQAEKERLTKEISGAEAEKDRLGVRLADQAFLTKAPAAVVNKEKEKLATLTDKVARLKQELGKLG